MSAGASTNELRLPTHRRVTRSEYVWERAGTRASADERGPIRMNTGQQERTQQHEQAWGMGVGKCKQWWAETRP